MLWYACIGLPVIIRHNEATELCITKGQEAIVVGWQSDIGERKKPILDTLFVELVDLPKPIQIPGLPANVVALTARKDSIWCNLPDDSTIQVTRSQIPVLPNFAMTDYSSQGKTRPINVVDLNNCRTHFSFYTALSRGTSSAGTFILQGADYSKITKGINGYLRQEFRELEILNEITRLRYEGLLPPQVHGDNRPELIMAFYASNKNPFELTDVHPALRSKPGEQPINALPVLKGKWEMIGDERIKYRKAHVKSAVVAPSVGKRPVAEGSGARALKRMKVAEPLPVGTVWDRNDYSCAYDALFTCLYDMWDDFRPMWTERLGALGLYGKQLCTKFESVHGGKQALDTARDKIREVLTDLEPHYFPRGRTLTALDRLTTAMFGANSWGRITTICTKCDAPSQSDKDLSCNLLVTQNNQLINKYKATYSISHWLKAQRVLQGDFKCRSCGTNTIARTVFTEKPPVLFVHMPVHAINIDSRIEVQVQDSTASYLLRGVVYLGDNHFTARIIRRTGQCWYHNGQLHGGLPVCEDNLQDHVPGFLQHHRDEGYSQKAVGALYALSDI
ncbi:hypothetical protein C8R45DRAFT_840437 [Mycena sanguinolenta]|nr:hypothetical protein C8R45DRAFT_840437 [Mycena sanguinolenta]